MERGRSNEECISMRNAIGARSSLVVVDDMANYRNRMAKVKWVRSKECNEDDTNIGQGDTICIHSLEVSAPAYHSGLTGEGQYDCNEAFTSQEVDGGDEGSCCAASVKKGALRLQ